jgi:hypothetical protein
MLGDMEIAKDTVQDVVEGAFEHVGNIASIIAGAGREVTKEIGGWATDMFEMGEAARRARADREDGDGDGDED